MPGFTLDEIKRCTELLESFVADRRLMTAIPEAERVALLIAAGRVSRPTREENRGTAKAFRKVEKARSREADRAIRAQTEIREARRHAVWSAPPRLAAAGANQPERELATPRNCYVCKDEYTRLHHFYDSMCPPCAALNYEKRFQTAPLDGRVALITGARVKIGYQAALMMLRAGAHVIVTTRFPRDAAARFCREHDFSRWADRLEVHGLDLRHAPSVELFTRYLCDTKPRLDLLINNAAQTVRRPPGFYAHLLPHESAALDELPEEQRHLLRHHESCKASVALGAREAPPLVTSGALPLGVVTWRGDAPGIGIRGSALLSQVPCADDEAIDDARVFPAGRADADLQQVDLRTVNSWRLRLADVPSPEMLEVQLVNAVAPFILCSKLKPLMARDRTDEKHVVNVSAVEGQFSRRTKTDKHPHTNMAKAALNMMTLTSAPDFAADGIFMNAVDTGWVTDEDPAAHSQRKQEAHDFQPPLDVVDGAARVCDPFFSGLLTGDHVWGKFLKDYAPAPW